MSKVTDLIADLRNQATGKLVVEGGASIQGEVWVQGSKNANNKLIAVAVAVPGRYEITNFPIILDALEMLVVIELMGGVVVLNEETSTVFVDTRKLMNTPLSFEQTKSTTGVFGYAGALLGRFGSVQIGKPGGDAIGVRPVDLHVEAFRQFGAVVDDNEFEISAELAASTNEPIKLRFASVGAYVNLILAVIGSGRIAVIEGAPVESDMTAMYDFIKRLNIVVEHDDAGNVRIDATQKRAHEVVSVQCVPDRNDAATWLAYGMVSDGLTINGLIINDMQPALELMKNLGCTVEQKSDHSVFIKTPSADAKKVEIRLVSTQFAGGFHSDWLPMFEAALCQLSIDAECIDTLYSNRVRQAEVLQDMGADIAISGGTPPDDVQVAFRVVSFDDARYKVCLHGPRKLKAKDIAIGYDVRACASTVLAATQAIGVSRLTDFTALFRGYANIVPRLQAIGAKVNIE